MAKIQTLAIPNAGEDVEQQEFSFIGNKTTKWYSRFWYSSLEVSYKNKHTWTIQSRNCAPWYLPKGKLMFTQMFTEVLFIILKTWQQPRCPSIGEWINKLGDIYGILLSTEKK